MGTYYGYTNRDQDKSVIDWAGITKTISEDIFKEKNSRETQKFELQKTQDEQLRKLDTVMQGLDKSANQAAMEAAQGYRDFLMENHKLMKDGLMSVNDSKLVKSNAKATWATLNTAFKGHQDAYKAKVEAGGEGNMLLAERMSEMFDFQNKKIIPSKNGEAVFVNIDPKTGKIDMDTAMPVAGLLNNQQRMWDTIDVQASASKAADAAGIYQYSKTSTRTISDIRENEDFAKWKTNTILAALDTPQRIASVLMDYLNVDSDDIKMVEDSQGVLQPELTPDQIQDAKDAYGSALEIGLGYSDLKDYTPPSRDSGITKSKKATMDIIDNFVLDGEYSALKAVLGQVANNVTLDSTTKTLKVMLNDGRVKTIDLSQNPKAIGVDIAGILSPDDAKFYNSKARSRKSGSKLNPDVYTINYTPISVKTSLTDSEVNKLSKELLPIEGKDITDNVIFTPVSDQQVLTAVSTSARALGLNPRLVTVSGDRILYDTKEIGVTGSSTGSQIANELESLKKNASSVPVENEGNDVFGNPK